MKERLRVATRKVFTRSSCEFCRIYVSQFRILSDCESIDQLKICADCGVCGEEGEMVYGPRRGRKEEGKLHISSFVAAAD